MLLFYAELYRKTMRALDTIGFLTAIPIKFRGPISAAPKTDTVDISVYEWTWTRNSNWTHENIDLYIPHLSLKWIN